LLPLFHRVWLTLEPSDYTLNNPDTLTKYNDAATITQKVLSEVTKAAVPGATILSLCQKGDELLEAETSKIYNKGKISKGSSAHPQVWPSLELNCYRC
jgi:methionine aminopeptidase